MNEKLIEDLCEHAHRDNICNNCGKTYEDVIFCKLNQLSINTHFTDQKIKKILDILKEIAEIMKNDILPNKSD